MEENLKNFQARQRVSYIRSQLETMQPKTTTSNSLTSSQ